MNRWGNSLDLEGLRTSFPEYTFTEGRTIPFGIYLPYRVAHAMPNEDDLTPAVRVREKKLFNAKKFVAYRSDAVTRYTTSGSGKPLAIVDCEVTFNRSLGNERLEDALREILIKDSNHIVEGLVSEGYNANRN